VARRAAGAGAGVMSIRIRIDDEMDFRNVGESRSVIRFCCGEGESAVPAVVSTTN
jgi:hypothetical protein